MRKLIPVGDKFILDKGFKYTKSQDTDLKKRFDEIRAGMVQTQQPQPKVRIVK